MKYIFEIIAFITIAGFIFFSPHWFDVCLLFAVFILFCQIRGTFERVKKYFTKNIKAAQERKADYDKYLKLKENGFEF